MGLIYLVRNRLNGKCYLGKTEQSLQARKANHQCRAKKGSDAFFHRALCKYGFDAFEWMFRCRRGRT